MAKAWSPSSWHTFHAEQQPEWPDQGDLDRALKQIASYPPLVFAGEARSLQASLAQVAAGNAFLLQAGDCAESFEEFSAVNIREKLRVILQMSVVLTYSLGVPVVKVGRIAGQFAKPRSQRRRDGRRSRAAQLPRSHGQRRRTHRGGPCRQPRSSGAGLQPVGRNPEPAPRLHQGRLRRPRPCACLDARVRRQQPRGSALSADRATRSKTRCASCAACGVDTEHNHQLHETDVYTSHEALLLGYEEALTRQDSLTGGWYDCSAHMLWIGNRTRDLDPRTSSSYAASAIRSAASSDPTRRPTSCLELCERLNPARMPGRLTLISRMGSNRVEDALRPLLRAVRESGHPVVWACDPMHGNTTISVSGRKTRDFNVITDEIDGFVRAHKAEGTWPGGIHVELTGDNVTECTGGADKILDSQLDDRYQTVCDPRLNGRQSLDLAFHVAETLRSTGLA